MCGSTIVRPCLTSWKAASRLVLRYNVSVPRRLNLRPCSPAPAPDKGSPWRSAQCAGRRHGLAALQPGDHGLRRSHRLGDPFLRLVGFAARLDDRGGDGELVFPRVMGRDKFPVLVARAVENEGMTQKRQCHVAKAGIQTWPHVPGPWIPALRGNDTGLKNLILNDAPPARALGGDVFPTLVPPSPISGPWALAYLMFLPKHGSMRYVCQKDGLLLFSNRSSC